MPVQQMDLFSWNMQRGSSNYGIIGTNYFAAAATYGRAELLTRMSARAVGFVQESGADLYSLAHSGRTANWSTYDLRHDNQLSDTSACRPVLYDRDNAGEQVVLMDCWSGGEDAYRLVAARKVLTAVGTGLFVSLHSTSGYNGESNTKAVIDTIIGNYLLNPLFGASFAVIGADFNWTARDYVSERRNDQGNTIAVSFNLPNDPTHQGGETYDGFCFMSTVAGITHRWTTRAALECFDTPALSAHFYWGAGGDESRIGYFVTIPRGARVAVDRDPLGESLQIKVSDHCAVTGTVQLTA